MIKLILPLLAIGTVVFLLNYNPSIEKTHKLKEIAKKINNNPKSTWTATKNHQRFYNKKDLSKMFNLIIEKSYPENFTSRPKSLKTLNLPENFDSREQWSQCTSIREVRDQSACGSCWAFGAASAMSDRLCIASLTKNGEPDQTRVSPEDLMECCSSCGFGCNGGYLYQSWSYFKRTGIVTGDLHTDTDFCKPYAFPSCNHHSHNPDRDDCSSHDYQTPSCKRKCSNSKYEKSYQEDLITGDSVYGVTGEQEMMEELVEHGPFEVAFTVYEDFLTYKKGVYQHTEGSALGGHAIRILGYGVENGVKYWLCANSWNEDWGDQGFFKILRGHNHCDIEESGVGGKF